MKSPQKVVFLKNIDKVPIYSKIPFYGHRTLCSGYYTYRDL